MGPDDLEAPGETTPIPAGALEGKTLAKRPEGVPSIPDVSIEREIGRGGMGVVYSGRQIYLDRRVAVKVLSNPEGGEKYAKRFHREARILASLTHEHIVSCYQAGTLPDGQCFLVMEYIDGPDLFTWLKQNGAMSVQHSLEVTRDMALALGRAMELSIIHRDVKPPNVLLQKDPEHHSPEFPFRAKLADLGLARATEESSTKLELTLAGTVMGSPATMSPEQFDDPNSVDYRSDIYALGCVLYHMLTGKKAYPQPTLTEMVARKTRDPCPDPRKLRPDLPDAIAEYTMKMLAVKREDRPQSYASIVGTCQAFLRNPPKPRKPRWKRAALMAAPVAIVLAVAGIWWAGRDRGRPERNVESARVVPALDDGPPAQAVEDDPDEAQPGGTTRADPLPPDPSSDEDTNGPGATETPIPQGDPPLEHRPAETESNVVDPKDAPATTVELAPPLTTSIELLQRTLDPIPDWTVEPEDLRRMWSWFPDRDDMTWIVVGPRDRLSAVRTLPAGDWRVSGLLELRSPDRYEVQACVQVEFESGDPIGIELVRDAQRVYLRGGRIRWGSTAEDEGSVSGTPILPFPRSRSIEEYAAEPAAKVSIEWSGGELTLGLGFGDEEYEARVDEVVGPPVRVRLAMRNGWALFGGFKLLPVD